MRRIALAAVLAASLGFVVGSHTTAAPTFIPPQSARVPDGAKPAPHLFGLAPAGGKHVSTAGLHLIEGFEGFGSCPYWDQYGRVWTRGYGETEGIHGGSACIGRAYGEANLRSRLERFYEYALRGLGVELTQNQWDALDSFVWNLGAGIFTGTLRHDLQTGQWQAAASVMLQYDHAGGVVLEGLRTRRIAEVRLFLSSSPAPKPVSRTELKRRLDIHSRNVLILRHLILIHQCALGGHRHATPHGFREVCNDWLDAGKHENGLVSYYYRLGVR